MYYRDLVILAQPRDVRFFLNQLMMLVHEKHDQLGVAVTFPQWKAGVPNDTTVFDSRINHAEVGNVLRLFHHDASYLDGLLQVLSLQDLLDKRVLFVTPTQPVPAYSRTVAYVRSRANDHLARLLRHPDVTEARRNEAKEAYLAKLHTLMYVPMSSTTDSRKFSLFVARLEGEAAAAQVQVGSYGVSSAQTPCFLPDF